MANAVIIIFFNFIYRYVGLWLTYYENHRDYHGFLQSYATKSCCFQFVNCYSSLLYMAFFKEVVEGDNAMTDMCPSPNAVLGFNCELGLTNRYLATLVFAFCGRIKLSTSHIKYFLGNIIFMRFKIANKIPLQARMWWS